MHILPNTLKSKGKESIKFDHLIEYNIKNIFLEKSYGKCSGEAIPKPFYKKWKLSISPVQQSEML